MTKERPLMRSDQWLTVRMIGSELNLNHQTVYNILTEELGMWKICTKLVPKNLTNKQKENWRNVCLDLPECIRNDKNFLKHVITGDESWIFRVWSQNQRLSLEWHTSNSPCLKKARMSKLKIKSMLICFFNSQGGVHKKFVPQGQTFNKQYYREVHEWLRERVHHVWPKIVDTWMVRHGNAPCCTAISVNEFLTKKGIPVVLQPPYLPYLSPCDVFLSQNKNSTSKVIILDLWTTSRRLWHTSWGHLHMKTSSTITGSGSNISGSMWLPKGTNLKGIMLIFGSVVNKKFYSTSLITF